jgi:hypothetical protein
VVGTLDSEGDWLYEQAVALELEGIVGKCLDSLVLPRYSLRELAEGQGGPGAVPPERFRNSRTT